MRLVTRNGVVLQDNATTKLLDRDAQRWGIRLRAFLATRTDPPGESYVLLDLQNDVCVYESTSLDSMSNHIVELAMNWEHGRAN